jgi:hypothetical protein
MQLPFVVVPDNDNSRSVVTKDSADATFVEPLKKNFRRQPACQSRKLLTFSPDSFFERYPSRGYHSIPRVGVNGRPPEINVIDARPNACESTTNDSLHDFIVVVLHALRHRLHPLRVVCRKVKIYARHLSNSQLSTPDFR